MWRMPEDGSVTVLDAQTRSVRARHRRRARRKRKSGLRRAGAMPSWPTRGPASLP
jgi:hypothetical protein